MIKFRRYLESVGLDEPTHYVLGFRGPEIHVTFTREYKNDKGKTESKVCPGQDRELNLVFLPGRKIDEFYNDLKQQGIFDSSSAKKLIIPINYQEWLIRMDSRFIDVITNLDPKIKDKLSHVGFGGKFGMFEPENQT